MVLHGLNEEILAGVVVLDQRLFFYYLKEKVHWSVEDAPTWTLCKHAGLT